MATLRLAAASALACAVSVLSLGSTARAAPGDVTITVSPRPAVVGQPVTFTANAEPPPGAQIAPNGFNWAVRTAGGNWEPLDQHGSAAQHVFSQAGAAQVQVEVAFTAPATSPVSASASFLVSEPSPTASAASPKPAASNQPPIASIRFSPSSPRVGEQVDFRSFAHDPDGSIVREQWDFDEDGRYDAEGWAVSRAFGTAGPRTVGLRVTDSGGATAIAFASVEVRPADRLMASRLLSPFPVVRIRGLLLRMGVRVTMLQVRAGPGVSVAVRCRGVGCPYPGARAETKRGREVRIRRFERYLRAGTRLEVLVTKPGRIGKYTEFTIRRGRPPSRRDMCIWPGAKRRSACPSD